MAQVKQVQVTFDCAQPRAVAEFWKAVLGYVDPRSRPARWDLAPEHVRVRAHAGNSRLHEGWLNYSARHKKHTAATTAIARELAGWCWSLAVLE